MFSSIMAQSFQLSNKSDIEVVFRTNIYLLLILITLEMSKKVGNSRYISISIIIEKIQ